MQRVLNIPHLRDAFILASARRLQIRKPLLFKLNRFLERFEPRVLCRRRRRSRRRFGVSRRDFGHLPVQRRDLRVEVGGQLPLRGRRGVARDLLVSRGHPHAACLRVRNIGAHTDRLQHQRDLLRGHQRGVPRRLNLRDQIGVVRLLRRDLQILGRRLRGIELACRLKRRNARVVQRPRLVKERVQRIPKRFLKPVHGVRRQISVGLKIFQRRACRLGLLFKLVRLLLRRLFRARQLVRRLGVLVLRLAVFVGQNRVSSNRSRRAFVQANELLFLLGQRFSRVPRFYKPVIIVLIRGNGIG